MNKRLTEWCVLILILTLLKASEISLLSSTPIFFAPIGFLPVFLTYSAVTRSWFLAVGLSLFFAVFYSSTSAINPLIFVSACVVSALICKSIVAAFALENRRSFSYLCVLTAIVMKIWIFGASSSRGTPVIFNWEYFFHLILNSSLMFAIGWILFPWMIKWDEFFGHDADDARELRSHI